MLRNRMEPIRTGGSINHDHLGRLPAPRVLSVSQMFYDMLALCLNKKNKTAQRRLVELSRICTVFVGTPYFVWWVVVPEYHWLSAMVS